ncbi:MAG: hypothetical protein GY795_46350 [Desulfobacterales bacterium]|nr:hypothetical protein [Desulfobacterales bacterium]
MRTKIFILAAFFIVCRTCPVFSETLKLTVDERDWFPFTFQENSQGRGMHVDIANKALKSLGYETIVKPYPRKRCIKNLQYGLYDAMISVAYHKELAGVLDFPPDADKIHESLWRIMQVDYVIVSYGTEDSYEFEGDIKTLPLPVRIPFGETLSLDMKNAGLKVDEARTEIQNFKKLMRDKKGVVITTSVIAERMNQDPFFRGQIKIHATPLQSRSYHLAFSKESKLSPEDKKKIWEEIRRWRDDYVYMLQLFALY